MRNEDLTDEEISWSAGEILSGNASESQIAAFAALLRSKGETVPELVALVRSMREFGESVNITDAIDTCGTGGDRAGTINVSTGAAIVAAASGAKVVKHGNRAASSQCGSADVLEALGVNIECSPAGVEHCVAETGIGFCFAPKFHPAMRHAVSARKALGIPTTFNFLGPLANPAQLRGHSLGVSDPTMAERMARALSQLGVKHVLVFCGQDGLDEMTTTGTTSVWELQGDELRTYEVKPQDVGLNSATREQLSGGNAQTNAKILMDVFHGVGGPPADIVAFNAGAALVVAGIVNDLRGGVERAAQAMNDGSAIRTLEEFVRVSQEAGNG